MKIASATCASPVRSGGRICTLDLRTAPALDGRPLELVFLGVEKTVSSLILRISISSPAVVVGELYTYGEGPSGATNERSRFSPMTLTLDVSNAAGLLVGLVNIDLKILDHQGQELTSESIYVRSLELHSVDRA